MSDNHDNMPDDSFDLLAIAMQIADGIAGNEHHGDAVSLIVAEFLNRGDVDNAALAADSVSDPFTRDSLLLQTAEKCAEIDDDDYALQLADAIEDPGRRLAAIEKIGIVKARKGQQEKALELAETHPHPDAILAEIAVNSFLRGDSEKAFELIKKIEFRPAAIDALTAAAEELIKSRENEQAAAILGRAADEAANLDQPDDLADKMVAIAALFSAAGRNDLAISALERARQAADQIQGPHRDRLLAAVAVGFARAGSTSLADITLDAITDLTQLSASLKSISDIYRSNNKNAEADEMLDEAYELLRSEKESQRRDSRSTFALQTAIALNFVEISKPERAIEAAEAIPLADYSRHALISIAAALAARGESENARSIALSMPADADRAFCLLAIADVSNADSTSATQCLDQAAEIADGIQQTSLRAEILREIAARYLKQENPESANTLRQTLIETLPMLRDRTAQIREIINLGRIFGFQKSSYDEREIQTLRRLAIER